VVVQSGVEDTARAPTWRLPMKLLRCPKSIP
jgi:hypothetical protein